MTFPEPPWTQAPSEVMAWGSSVGGRGPSRLSAHRRARVKGYAIHLPVSEESRILGRLSRSGLVPSRRGRIHVPRVLTRITHHAADEAFLGRMGGTRIELRIRKRSRLEVHMTFTPTIAFRKAWRMVSRLGLRPTEGTWL